MNDDTPKTNAEVYVMEGVLNGTPFTTEYVKADFARALERELTARERDLRECVELLAANVSIEVQSDCRWDQHGNCQAHYVESPCRVAEARALLARLKVTKPCSRNPCHMTSDGYCAKCHQEMYP